jgi:hypothetical protein
MKFSPKFLNRTITYRKKIKFSLNFSPPHLCCSRRRLRSPDPLVDGDVLPDEPRDLVRLLRLDARDALLHQVTALHVKEQSAVLGLDLRITEMNSIQFSHFK